MSEAKTTTESKITTNHNKIKEWVEEREGEPAIVEDTDYNGDAAGLLRINFSDGQSDNLKKISWDKFFETFDDENLAFLYQEEKDGDKSRFFKLVNRES